MLEYMAVRSGGRLIYKALLPKGGSGAAIVVRAMRSADGRGYYLIEGIDKDRYYLPVEEPPIFSIETESTP